MMQDIEYNGILASNMKLLVSEEISLPSAKPKYEEYDIAGRDGALTEENGTYEDVVIKIPFNYVEGREWGAAYRRAKKWLNEKGNNQLRLGRMSDNFYIVKRIEIGNDERKIENAGGFTASFTCDPYTYFDSGLIEIEEKEIYNPYEISHPTYLITGNGTCTLTVNGKTMSATVGQNLTIDTDRMLAYRVDGTMMNTSVVGDYEDLYLLPGDNDISITAGFDLKVIPNWRCL